MICASEDNVHAGMCDRAGFCTVNVLWVRVREAVAATLDSMTLADLVRPRAIPHPRHTELLNPISTQETRTAS
jgi:DNA-binding IscR family transcriptional regulator